MEFCFIYRVCYCFSSCTSMRPSIQEQAHPLNMQSYI